MTLFHRDFLHYAHEVSVERHLLWTELQDVLNERRLRHFSRSSHDWLANRSPGYLRHALYTLRQGTSSDERLIEGTYEYEARLLYKAKPHLHTFNLIEQNGCAATLVAGLEFYSDDIKDELSGEDMYVKIAVLLDAAAYTYVNCPPAWSEAGHTGWGDGYSLRYAKLPDRTAALLLKHYDRADIIHERLTVQKFPADYAVYEDYLENAPKPLADGVL